MPLDGFKISPQRKLTSKIRRSWNDKVKSPLSRIFERFRGRPEIIEGRGTIRTDVANIHGNGGVEEQKNEVVDKRLDEKQTKQTDKDPKIIAIGDLSEKLFNDFVADRSQRGQPASEAERPGFESLIEVLREQAAEQRELLSSLFESWRSDTRSHHEETIAAVRHTASEQVPFNVQGYLDEFNRALASEVRMLLGEVGKLREERRALHYELAFLLSMKYKYGPGGEFEPDWRPSPGTPLGAPPSAPSQPPGAPRDSPTTSTKPGWRAVPQNDSKEKEPLRPTPGPNTSFSASTPPVPDFNRTFQSWATWQPSPSSSPPIQPRLIVPDYTNPGLFGPRSRKNSSHSEDW